jgi:hypothetical protein
MPPPDLRTTRTYYWTWQACSVAFAIGIGSIAYLILSIGEETPADSLAIGIIVGIVATSTWHRTKWKDGR